LNLLAQNEKVPNCLVLKQVVIYGYIGLLKVEARSTGACMLGSAQAGAAAHASHAGGAAGRSTHENALAPLEHWHYVGDLHQRPKHV